MVSPEKADLPRIKLCELCVKLCLFDIRKVAGSRQECKCEMCKRLHECFEYEIRTAGGGVVIRAKG